MSELTNQQLTFVFANLLSQLAEFTEDAKQSGFRAGSQTPPELTDDEKINLAKFYAPMFSPEIRNGENFLDVFKHCFGHRSSRCRSPRPLLCLSCLVACLEYIHLAKQHLDEKQTELANTVIIPRLENLYDCLKDIYPSYQDQNSTLDLDLIFSILDIQLEDPNPPSEEAIKECKIYELKDEVKETCAICRDDLKVGEQVMQLNCPIKNPHRYHHECITPWLKEHSTCPTCNHPMNGVGDSPSP
jgi:hypothetical protein